MRSTSGVSHARWTAMYSSESRITIAFAAGPNMTRRSSRISRGSAFAGDEPIRRQHDEEWAYEHALHALARSHHVYACDCSRRDITAAADIPGEEVRYTGRCRTRGLDAASGCGLRVVIEPGLERFDDALLGEQVQDPA